MFKQSIAMALFALVMTAPGRSEEPVRIAYNNLLPPFSESKDGQARGLVVDIFRAAAQRAGYDIQFMPVPLDQMEEAIKDGRVVAAIPLAMSADRRERLDFSHSLLDTGGALFVRAPEATPKDLQALAGQILVTPRTGPLAAFIQKTAPSVKLVVTEDYETSLAQLVAGKAAAAALNYQTGAILARRLYPAQITEPRSMFLELPFAAAVLKGRNGDFLSRLNKGLEAIRADGTWDRINKTWVE